MVKGKTRQFKFYCLGLFLVMTSILLIYGGWRKCVCKLVRSIAFRLIIYAGGMVGGSVYVNKLRSWPLDCLLMLAGWLEEVCMKIVIDSRLLVYAGWVVGLSVYVTHLSSPIFQE